MSQTESKLNPLAVELNNIIKKNPNLFNMLSNLGKKLYFPKGILSQSAEARQKAFKYNATIGIATENKEPMHLQSIKNYFNDLNANELFDYAPASGKPELRQKWRETLLEGNPSLQGKNFSLPLVTSGVTHALSTAADLFIEEGDNVILSDKNWENYYFIFEVRRKAKIIHYPLFNDQSGFNISGIEDTLKQNRDKKKLIVLLNFPNNPTGYSITVSEAPELVNVLNEATERGQNLVVICDDAYFGLFFEEDVLKESIFGHIVNLNNKLLAIKTDGATKEQFVWGFRTGFITFGCGNTDKTVYEALEEKAMGCIRGTISNCSLPAQSIILKALEAPGFKNEQTEKLEILKSRALKVKEVLSSDKYEGAWDVYPFNSGYFMCLRLRNVDAEKLRQHLLENYGLGVIALGESDIRVAFSCLELDNIQEVFDIIYAGINDLQSV